MPAAKTQKVKSVSSRKASPIGSKKASPSKSKKASPPKSKKASLSNSKKLPQPGAIAKKRPLFSKDDLLSIYIFRILKKVHPDVGISKTAMTTINSILLDIYRSISRSAV